MIDLHSHTNESDGSFSPAQLIDEARRAGVRTLSITDHDTFAGYDQAVALAPAAGVELICGIELSTKFDGQSVHLLGYFLEPARLVDLRKWLLDLQASRRERNVRLVARLRELGINITLAEAEARGKGMTGRPHFAQLLIEKGYVATVQQAFDEFLAESAKGYVTRDEPPFHEGVQRIRDAGGIASLAHPIRVKGDLTELMPGLHGAGLSALEAYHSDHRPEDTELYLSLADQYKMLVTGGSDFHGAVKPGIALGTGRNGNVKVPGGLIEAWKASRTA